MEPRKLGPEERARREIAIVSLYVCMLCVGVLADDSQVVGMGCPQCPRAVSATLILHSYLSNLSGEEVTDCKSSLVHGPNAKHCFNDYDVAVWGRVSHVQFKNH